MGSCRYWIWITPKKFWCQHSFNNRTFWFCSFQILAFTSHFPGWVRIASRRLKKQNTPPNPVSISIRVFMPSGKCFYGDERFHCSSIRPFISNCFWENCRLGFNSSTTQRYEPGLSYQCDADGSKKSNPSDETKPLWKLFNTKKFSPMTLFSSQPMPPFLHYKYCTTENQTNEKGILVVV